MPELKLDGIAVRFGGKHIFYQVDRVGPHATVIKHERDVQVISSHPDMVDSNGIVPYAVGVLRVQLDGLLGEDIPDIIYFNIVIILPHLLREDGVIKEYSLVVCGRVPYRGSRRP